MPKLPLNLASVPLPVPPVPEGLYAFRITEVEIIDLNTAAGQRIRVACVVIDGPCAGRKVYQSYAVNEKGAPYLKRLFLACGFPKSEIEKEECRIELDWLIGRDFVANVVERSGYTMITGERPDKALRVDARYSQATSEPEERDEEERATIDKSRFANLELED